MDAVQAIIETTRQVIEAAMPTTLLVSGVCAGVVVLCIVASLFAAKTRQLEQSQERFVPPPFLQLGNAKFPKGHSAEIIDFKRAREPALAKKQARENARMNSSLVRDSKVATSTDLDNFIFTEGDDDHGPHAA